MPARKKSGPATPGRGRSRKRKDQLLDELKDQDAQLADDETLISQLRSDLDAADTLVDEKLFVIEAKLKKLFTEADQRYISYDPETDDGDQELAVDDGHKAARHHIIRALVVLALLAAAASVVVVIISSRADAKDSGPDYQGVRISQAKFSLDNLTQQGNLIGSQKANHRLVIYGDLSSSRLRETYQSVLKPLLEQKGDDLQVSFHPIAKKDDPEAQWAARVALVAAAHDHLLQFIDSYFEAGRKVSHAAREAGLKGWRKAARHGKSKTISDNRADAHRLLTGDQGAMVVDGQVMALNTVLPAVRKALSS